MKIWEVDVEDRCDPYGQGFGYSKLVYARSKVSAKNKTNKWCKKNDPTMMAARVRNKTKDVIY